MDDFSYYIKKYLTIHLKEKINASDNCIQSYRDTFKLLLLFYKKELKLNISELNFEIFSLSNIDLFINWLKTNRNSSLTTCNQRLACLKSFSKYLIYELPEMLSELQRIILKPQLKIIREEIKFLSTEEIKFILDQPNQNTKKGLKELVILSVLYDTGIRVTELINLSYDDLRLGEVSIIKVLGKGNKYRTIPISDNLRVLLSQYINKFNISNGILFKSNQNKKYTSNGIRYIISKYTKEINFKVTPHTFRHSKASHLVEANVPLIYIRDLLGHEHVSTTEIYAKVNIKTKTQVLNQNSNLESKTSNTWNKNEELMEWLNNL